MISPSFLVRRLASLSPEKKSTKARLLSLQRNATDAFIDGGSSTGAAFVSSAAIGSGAVVVTVSAFCWQPASTRIAAGAAVKARVFIAARCVAYEAPFVQGRSDVAPAKRTSDRHPPSVLYASISHR